MPIIFNTSAPGASAILISGGIEIHKRHVTETAPEVVELDVDLDQMNTQFSLSAPSGITYDTRFSEIAYVWSFDDSGSTYSAPTNVLSAWNDSNVAYGPRVAHLFQSAGTYSVRCDMYAFVGGNIKNCYSTLNVTVISQATTFSGADHITVNSSGGEDYTTVEAAINAVKGQQTTPKLIEVTGGGAQTFGTHTLGNNASNQVPSLYIINSSGSNIETETFGTSATVFDYPDSEASSSNSKDFVVSGFNINGPFVAATNTNPTSTTSLLHIRNTAPKIAAFIDCNISGFDISVLGGPSDSDGLTLALVNSTVSDWQGYFTIYGDATDPLGSLVLLGAQIAEDVDAFIDGAGNSGTTGSCVRFTAERVIFDCVDMFVRHGQGFSVPRSCVRFNAESLTGWEANIQRSVFEGGNTVFGTGGGGGTTSYAPGNGIIDSCLFLTDYGTNFLFGGSGAGFTIRNNRMFIADITTADNRVSDYFQMSVTPPNGNEYYNVEYNTIVNHVPSGSGSNPTVFDTGVSTLNGRRQNNIIYEVGDSTADGPLTQTPVLFTPRNKGEKEVGGSNDTAYATPTDVVWPSVPDTGAGALDGATTGNPFYLDANHNVRAATANAAHDLGAIQT